MNTTTVYQEFSDILIKNKADKRRKKQFFLFKVSLWSLLILCISLISFKVISLLLCFVLVGIICVIAPIILFSIPFGKPITLNKREIALCVSQVKIFREKYDAIMEEQKILLKERDEAKRDRDEAKNNLWKKWLEMQKYKGENTSRENFERFCESTITPLSGV